MESLLSHHAGSSGAHTHALAAAVAEASAGVVAERGAPAFIGPYRVLGVLGEGGMGVVYEAEQQTPRRRVALKVVRGGRLLDESSVRMFQREIETLGRLDHPNIAAIYESGRTDDGHHFFAMELVRGETLDQHLRVGGQGDLPAPEIHRRLGLFRQICDAVSYAHQRSVIHRDLKPSNIVVDEQGRVKILDFGLARITDSDTAAPTIVTEVGAIRGTLPYMSPEQVRGDPHAIDLRTDVYSLGVILYEMLAGRRPLDTDRSSIVEVVRVICEDPPRSLRGSGRRFDQDLETIVAKALEKSPERRYPTVDAFSEDVRRYASSEPILARPPSTFYLLRKLVARHRFPFAFAGVVAALILGFGVWMSVLYARAEIARGESEAVTGFLSDMLGAVGPDKQGRDVTVREVVDEAAGTIEEEFVGRPHIAARLQLTVGQVYRELGHYREAVPLLERALAAYESEGRGGSLDAAEVLTSLAETYRRAAEYDRALALFERALAIREREQGPDHRDYAWTLNGLGTVLLDTGRYAEARPVFERALALRERTLGPEHADVASTLNSLAILHKELGEYAEARPLYERAISIWESALGPERIEVASGMANLAEVHRLQGNLAEARPLFERALGIFERVLGPDHPEVALALNSNAIMRAESGDLAGAEALLERALAINERALKPDHTAMGQTLSNLAIVHSMTGEHHRAVARMERAVQVYESALGPDHARVARQLTFLAEVHLTAGDPASAEPLLVRALAIQEGAEDDPVYPATTAHHLACVRRDAGRLDDARALFARALEMREAQLGPESPPVAETLEEWAKLLRLAGEAEEAERAEARARAIRSRGVTE